MDDDDFYVVFSELKQRTYTLYCFTHMERTLAPLPPRPAPKAATAPKAKAAPTPTTGGAADGSSGLVKLRITPRDGGRGVDMTIALL